MPFSKYIVCKNSKPSVKTFCGHEFGDYGINWKVFAEIKVEWGGSTGYASDIHASRSKLDGDERVMCPNVKLLSVKAVPPRYPPVFGYFQIS